MEKENRWFFDENEEKAYEVEIFAKTTEESMQNPYWCRILETGRTLIFEYSSLYNSKNEALDVYAEKLYRRIEEEEHELKKYIKNKTELIEKYRTRLEKILKQKDN